MLSRIYEKLVICIIPKQMKPIALNWKENNPSFKSYREINTLLQIYWCHLIFMKVIN